MNLKLGWKKGKGISMASIRERNGKFNVIYNYKDDSGKRRQKWETYDTKAEAKKRKREIEYKQEMGALVVRKCNTLSDLLTEYVSLYGKEKWALSTYEGNVGLIRNYIEPMVGTWKNGVPSDRAQYSMIALPAFGSNAVAMKIRTLMIIRFNTTGGVWK